VSTLKRQEKIKEKKKNDIIMIRKFTEKQKAEGQQRMGIWDKQTWRPYKLKLIVKLALMTQYDLAGEADN
jgi:hypothetical protein